MGKNSRDRQKRVQRKRAKRQAKRSSKSSAVGPFGASSDVANPAVQTCVYACDVLLTDCDRLAQELRDALRVAARYADGVWLRLSFELEEFLCDGAPWSLTCADLEPARRAFAYYRSEETFDRLWALSLTNGPDALRRLAALEDPSCAQRAALAFEALRVCLREPQHDPAPAIASITREIKAHHAPEALRTAYLRLLATARVAAHAPALDKAEAIERLARDCRAVFDQGTSDLSADAWWECGRLVLQELIERCAEEGHSDALSADADLLAGIFDPPEALFWAAQRRAAIRPLRTIHIKSNAYLWLRFLRQRIDPQTLAFEDRVRYEIARLKMLRAHAQCMQIDSDETEAEQHEFLAAFEQLRTLITHGVPPASRSLREVLEPLLIEFYIAAVVDLNCDAAALNSTEALLRQHPDDYRLACLYATGALQAGEPKRLASLEAHPPRAHVDAELFARCVGVWGSLPRGADAATRVRPLLFDPFDREHRKRCLIQVARQALRRASNTAGYLDELRLLLPYFEKNSFVHRDLREKTALESELIFLAAMMAPLHGIELTLSESQSQQWVSHGREIAAQSRLGALLFANALKHKSRGFTLSLGVRSAALARLEEAERKAASIPPPGAATSNPSNPSKPKRRRRKARSTSPAQRGLFDELSP